MQIYARGRSQAVDGRLIAAMQALHGGKEDAEAYAKAAVGARCREVCAAPLNGAFPRCADKEREHQDLLAGFTRILVPSQHVQYLAVRWFPIGMRLRFPLSVGYCRQGFAWLYRRMSVRLCSYLHNQDGQA